MIEYAIIQTGGKQYSVRPGDGIDVEKLEAESGSTVELLEVLAVREDANFKIGKPILSGVRVVARVEAQTKDKKITIFKYKRKTRYRRKQGHRQPLTKLVIEEIVASEEKPRVTGKAKVNGA